MQRFEGPGRRPTLQIAWRLDAHPTIARFDDLYLCAGMQLKFGDIALPGPTAHFDAFSLDDTLRRAKNLNHVYSQTG